MKTDKEHYDIGQYFNEYVETVPDKESRIINAAINIFSEKGFQSTGTREIAKRAGVAEGTVFRYFKNKDAILEKMVPLLIRVMQPKLEKPLVQIIDRHRDSDTAVIFGAILYDRLKIIRDNRRFLKSVLPELIYRPELLCRLKDSVIPMAKAYIARLLERAKQRGEISEEVDAETVSHQLFGFVLSYSLLGGGGDEAEVKKDIGVFLENAMDGWRRK